MTSIWRYVFVIAVLAYALIFAQQPASVAPSTLSFERGLIANGVYSNECLGFSYPIPAGWQVGAATAGGKGRRLSYKSLVLLFLQPDKGTLPGSRILLTARDAAGEKGTAEDFVTDAVSEQINSKTGQHELVRDTFAVSYGGKHFSGRITKAWRRRDPGCISPTSIRSFADISWGSRWPRELQRD